MVFLICNVYVMHFVQWKVENCVCVCVLCESDKKEKEEEEMDEHTAQVNAINTRVMCCEMTFNCFTIDGLKHDSTRH